MVRDALAPLRSRRNQGPVALAAYWPAATVVLASLLAALPLIPSQNWFPDFGYLMFLGWRLLRSDPWPSWWAAPLGLINDVFTGYPIGYSVALWSATMIALDLIDRRTMWRDYWVEWMLAAMLIVVDEALQWRVAKLVGAAPPFASIVPAIVISILVFPLFAFFVGRIDTLEARAMKMQRVTTAHQSITFSRRMILLGGAQAAVGAVLIGRLGYLSITQNQKYQLLSEENRVQLIPVPPRRGWLVDRNGKPIAINRSSFRVDIIPQQLTDPERVKATLAGLLQLPADEVARINKELESSKGFRPVTVADNIPYDQYAAISVRLPELPGVSASRGFSRFYPSGAAVGHLVGYVGTANTKEYEAENKNPLLLVPGVKIGKEGSRKDARTQASRRARRPAGRGHRARQVDPRARGQARPLGPDRPADDRRRPPGLCRRAGWARNRAAASSSTA